MTFLLPPGIKGLIFQQSWKKYDAGVATKLDYGPILIFVRTNLVKSRGMELFKNIDIELGGNSYNPSTYLDYQL